MADTDQDIIKLKNEGWRLVREFAPLRPQAGEFPREVDAIKLFAKAQLFEVAKLDPDQKEWQAVVCMAVEAAFNLGRANQLARPS